MLSFCKKKWPRTTSSEEKAEEDQAAEFQFKADGSVPDSAPNLHKRKNRNLTDVLLYYSSEVVSPELRNRLLRLKEEKESKQQRVTWQDAKELFLSYMEKPNMRLLLYSLTCTKRSDEEQWIDWVQGMILLKINCKKYGLMLPDELWADLAWCQSSSTERRIVGKRPATLEDLEKEVAKLPPRDLPTYRQSMCTRELARIPSINSKSKRRKDVKNLGINQGKSQPSPAGKSYCGYCRRQNAGHEFKDCPKLAKRKLRDAQEAEHKAPSKPDKPNEPTREKKPRQAKTEGERKRRGECFLCGEKGHMKANCPQANTKVFTSQMFSMRIPSVKSRRSPPPLKTLQVMHQETAGPINLNFLTKCWGDPVLKELDYANPQDSRQSCGCVSNPHEESLQSCGCVSNPHGDSHQSRCISKSLSCDSEQPSVTKDQIMVRTTATDGSFRISRISSARAFRFDDTGLARNFPKKSEKKCRRF